jgi:hypothetical protein
VLELFVSGGEVPGGGRSSAIEEEVDGAEVAFVRPSFSRAAATRREPMAASSRGRGLPMLAHGGLLFALFGGALTDARSAAREREQVVWAA